MASPSRVSLVVPLLIALSLALAGCSGSGKPKKTDDTTIPPSAIIGGNDAETCSINGSITDDEAQPVVDAAVGLLGSDPLLQTRTALDGSFSFGFVPPGTYQAAGSKTGYSPDIKKVTCVAGETARVDLVMPLIPIPDPPFRLVFQPQPGFIACAVGAPALGSTGTGDLCQNTPVDGNDLTSRVNLAVDKGNITGAVYELVWQATSGGLGGKYLSLVIPEPSNAKITLGPGVRATGSVTTYLGQSPLQLRIEGTNATAVLYEKDQQGSGMSFEARAASSSLNNVTANPADDGSSRLVNQQAFTLHVALFYNGEPVPEGYTLLG